MTTQKPAQTTDTQRVPADQPEPVVRCTGVSKVFDGNTVLDDINLDVLPGETMVIMGG